MNILPWHLQHLVIVAGLFLFGDKSTVAFVGTLFEDQEAGFGGTFVGWRSEARPIGKAVASRSIRRVRRALQWPHFII